MMKKSSTLFWLERRHARYQPFKIPYYPAVPPPPAGGTWNLDVCWNSDHKKCSHFSLAWLPNDPLRISIIQRIYVWCWGKLNFTPKLSFVRSTSSMAQFTFCFTMYYSPEKNKKKEISRQTWALLELWSLWQDAHKRHELQSWFPPYTLEGTYWILYTGRVHCSWLSVPAVHTLTTEVWKSSKLDLSACLKQILLRRFQEKLGQGGWPCRILYTWRVLSSCAGVRAVVPASMKVWKLSKMYPNTLMDFQDTWYAQMSPGGDKETEVSAFESLWLPTYEHVKPC